MLFRPFSGYGPPPEPPKPEIDIDIDIDNDLNIPDLENPIDDIDLGNGQIVTRPETAAATAEDDNDAGDQFDSFVRMCSDAAARQSDMAPHPQVQ